MHFAAPCCPFAGTFLATIQKTDGVAEEGEGGYGKRMALRAGMKESMIRELRRASEASMPGNVPLSVRKVTAKV